MHGNDTTLQQTLCHWLARVALAVPLALMLGACVEGNAQDKAEKPPVIIASILQDVNGDGVEDKVELVFDGETDADLNIHFGVKGQDELAATPDFTKKGIAFHGNKEGQNAALEAGTKATFTILSQNDTIGTERWSKALAVTFRNREFVVANLSYQERDSAGGKDADTCNVNFITGKSTRDERPFAGKSEIIALSEWEPDFLPKACEF